MFIQLFNFADITQNYFIQQLDVFANVEINKKMITKNMQLFFHNVNIMLKR